MRIGFNLEYQTTFGEELVLNILNEGKAEQHKMGTRDGLHWTCELSKAVKTSTHIDYFYSVMRGKDQMRTEWLVAPPSGVCCCKRGALYRVRPLD